MLLQKYPGAGVRDRKVSGFRFQVSGIEGFRCQVSGFRDGRRQMSMSGIVSGSGSLVGANSFAHPGRIYPPSPENG